jgi:hypothetical protein
MADQIFDLELFLFDTSWWCDVQLTKDGVGICLGDMDMKNNTNIASVYPGRDKKICCR